MSSPYQSDNGAYIPHSLSFPRGVLAAQTWPRFARYMVFDNQHETVIGPDLDSELSWYDPWGEFGSEDLRTRRRSVQGPPARRRAQGPAPLIELMRIVLPPENAPGQRLRHDAAAAGLSSAREQQLLRWCAQYGLLGVAQEDAEWLSRRAAPVPGHALPAMEFTARRWRASAAWSLHWETVSEIVGSVTQLRNAMLLLARDASDWANDNASRPGLFGHSLLPTPERSGVRRGRRFARLGFARLNARRAHSCFVYAGAPATPPAQSAPPVVARRRGTLAGGGCTAL